MVWSVLWYAVLASGFSWSMTIECLGQQRRSCTRQNGERFLKASTRIRWGCEVTLQRAACAGARHFFRERSQRRRATGGSMMQNQQASDANSSSCDATTVGARFAPEVQVRDEVCLLPESTFAGHLRRKRGRRGGCRRRSAHRVQELVSERETPAAREAGLYSPRSSSASESNLKPPHRDDENASKSRRTFVALLSYFC